MSLVALDDDTAAAHVTALYDSRKRDRGPMLERMRAVTDVYNGDIVLPLPELSAAAYATVTNITQQGLDQVAMRVASVMPNLVVPSARPGFERHDRAADDKRRAWLGMWASNDLQLMMRRRARWLLGYSQSPVLVRPDFERGTVRWRGLNPLHTFPAWCADPDDIWPADAIVATRMTYAELAKRWPAKALAIAHAPSTAGLGTRGDDIIDILDYYDADERICVAVGRRFGIHPLEGDSRFEVNPGRSVVLSRAPNRAEVPPVVVPGRITLERLVGSFDGVVGMHHTMTELMALSIAATKKGIIGETWLVARENGTPNIVQAADPMQGLPGIVEGAELKTVTMDPQWGTYAAVDRLEKASRESAGVPGDLTGSPSYARTTGRRADQLLSATIDFPIQEAQQILAKSLAVENEVAARTDVGYFASTRRSFHVSWPKASGHIDYTPAALWDSYVNFPSYALAGADSMSLNIELAQRVGAEMMSKDSARELDPLVDDPTVEKAKIVAERLEAAFMASIETQAADPAGPFQPVDMAKLVTLVAQGATLADAVMTVQREAQERQAAQAEVPADAQPGLSPPGMGVEQEMAPIGAPPTGTSNLASLLRATTTTGFSV